MNLCLSLLCLCLSLELLWGSVCALGFGQEGWEPHEEPLWKHHCMCVLSVLNLYTSLFCDSVVLCICTRGWLYDTAWHFYRSDKDTHVILTHEHECYQMCWCETLTSVCLSVDDHSRVRLQNLDGEQNSDYINANYVDVSTEAAWPSHKGHHTHQHTHSKPHSQDM